MKSAQTDKDYYGVLGVDEEASKPEIERQYKRQAAKHHPDLGGSEERMKSLNEAYGVLKDPMARREYDRGRQQEIPSVQYVPVSQPTARDVGVFGYCLSSLFCLLAGFFLLMLVRFQWIWFLWPLAILAVFVLCSGVVMARSAMKAFFASLPVTSPFKSHTNVHEVAFWIVVVTGAYGIYLIIL
jgi:hypothetical protein